MIEIIPGFVKTADGSCLISTGNTRVICTASVEESVPNFLREENHGWLTAEYAMLPASTGRRKARDGIRKDGRGTEIQRLIGRSLRQALDMDALGKRTVTIDCDVLQADGGTRTASITGAYVALVQAVHGLMEKGLVQRNPIVSQVAAISAGIVDNQPMLDLCYEEDSHAQVDMNFVMNERGEYIELQGTGEGRAFQGRELAKLQALAAGGIRDLMRAQRQALSPEERLLLPLMPVAVATDNDHKLKELQGIFQNMGLNLIPMRATGFAGEIVENGATFAENAIIKAETLCRFCGLPVIADDSGLSVDALDGAPGIYSARYAGDHGNSAANNALLLKNMEGVENRACRFVCAMALALPGETTRVVQGECPGTLLTSLQGVGGFGYDPLFLYENGQTFAEMPQELKNQVSHRARACEQMKALLAETLL